MKVKFIGNYPIKYIRVDGSIELVKKGDIVDVKEDAVKDLNKKLWDVSTKKIVVPDNKILKTEGDK